MTKLETQLADTEQRLDSVVKHTPNYADEVKYASEMTITERMNAVEELNWYRTEYAKQREQLDRYEQIIEDERNAHDDLVSALKHGKSMIKKSMTEGLSSDEKDWIYEIMDAALAKASGEQA